MQTTHTSIIWSFLAARRCGGTGGISITVGVTELLGVCATSSLDLNSQLGHVDHVGHECGHGSGGGSARQNGTEGQGRPGRLLVCWLLGEPLRQPFELLIENEIEG